MIRKTIFMSMIGIIACLAAHSGMAQPETVQPPVNSKIKAAPANTWVKLVEEETGGRGTPIFYYAPTIGRFVISGGAARDPQHYETEFFDAAAARWINAYPSGTKYKTESGPTDAPSSRYTGWPTPILMTDKEGILRLRMDTGGSTARPYLQYAYNSDDGKLYANIDSTTISYDPKTRVWTDLKADPFSKPDPLHFMYGSFAYDPLNKEILSIGGTSNDPGGTPGTWVYSAPENLWKKVDSGSAELRALGAEAEALRLRVLGQANTLRNRFHLTESEKEASVDLKAQTASLSQAVVAFGAKVKTSKFGGAESTAAEQAVRAAERLAQSLKSLADNLSSKPTTAHMAALPAIELEAWLFARALDHEPAGRGYGQLAADPERGKILLFGGSRMDGFLSDTWVYDCKKRTWEQRWPAQRPSARAGHDLFWHPIAKTFILGGGASRGGSALRDLWSYDVERNEWKKLAQLEQGPDHGVNGSYGAIDPAGQYIAVSIGRAGRKRITWGMQIDTSVAGLATSTEEMGSPIVYGLSPADYDSITEPNPDTLTTFLKDLPDNVWTMLPKPPKSTAIRDWGTLPYDTQRHQILHWGGGHSSYIGTDLAHYSLRTAAWSIGYHAENPPTRGFYALMDQTFNNHPSVPNHVWDAATFDPSTGKGVWHVRGRTWTYDPATRSWEYPPGATLERHRNVHTGELNIGLTGTPKGVVGWHRGKLYLYDSKELVWNELPVNGGSVGVAYGDHTGSAYDSKRNCIWMSNRSGPMMRYDMDSGDLTMIDTPSPAGSFMRETIYVPELDMLVNEVRVAVGDLAGNVAYDIDAGKWVGLHLPYAGEEQFIAGTDRKGFNVMRGSRSLHYDPVYKVAIQLIDGLQLSAVRFSKAGLKTFEVELYTPPTKK